VSQIFDKLKEAEAQRERLIAERKRLEAEADAALAAREREEIAANPQGAGAARPDPQRLAREMAEANARTVAQRAAQARAAAGMDAPQQMRQREVSETAARPAAQAPVPQDRPAVRNPWIGICVALLLGIAAGYLFSRKEPAPATVPTPAEPGDRLELKLERDLDSFSVRLKEKR